jgi:hypothetical protein
LWATLSLLLLNSAITAQKQPHKNDQTWPHFSKSLFAKTGGQQAEVIQSLTYMFDATSFSFYIILSNWLLHPSKVFLKGEISSLQSALNIFANSIVFVFHP